MNLKITSFCNTSMNLWMHKLVEKTTFPFFTKYQIIDVFAKILEQKHAIKLLLSVTLLRSKSLKIAIKYEHYDNVIHILLYMKPIKRPTTFSKSILLFIIINGNTSALKFRIFYKSHAYSTS